MSVFERLSAFRASFQFKLFFLFTTLFAVATIAIGALYILFEADQSRNVALEKLQLQTDGLAAAVRLPMYAENFAQLASIASEEIRSPEIRGVEITAIDGRVLVQLPVLRNNIAGQLLSARAEIRHSQAGPLLDPLAVDEAVQKRVKGHVTLYRGTDDLSQAIRRMIIATIATALLFWLLVTICCYLLLRRVTASFRDLISGLEKMRSGNYDSPIEVLTNDEPGRAALKVNELAAFLKSSDLQNRELTAELQNAIHEEVVVKELLLTTNRELQDEIAERSRARQELKDLLEQLPVGIIWSDADGTIEFHNNFALNHLGYEPEEIATIESLLLRICPEPEYRGQVSALRRTAINAWHDGNKDASLYEVRAVRKDGSTCNINCCVQISGTRFVDILIDMTEHELLHEQLIRNDKLESLGVMAGGIAHNFNNVLTGIMGYISFANKFLDESHRAYPLLCKAEESSRRAAGLANQLLTFARGGAPLKKTVCARELVEESVSLTLNGSRVQCHINMPPSLHAVLVDAGQICQVFNALCINALQAMPNGGSLVISGRNVSTAVENLPVQSEGDYVELSFKDQGCGIAEKNRANIFTPYFTTKAEVGTGLGLATAHSIITRHGGAISFVSAVGAGTTFTLYLPVANEIPRMIGTTEPVNATTNASGAGILVMDDEEAIRDLTGLILTRLGYRVSLVANGEDAVAAYKKTYESGAPYLASILDLTIPGGMGGTEAAQQILAFDPSACLVVSSGYSNDAIMNEFASYGFCAAIPKPYSTDELTRLLNKIETPVT